MTVLTTTAPIFGGIVTAQGTPNGTVAVTAATSLIANVVVAGAGSGSLDILGAHPADANYDRIDLVTQDTTGAFVMVTGTAQFGPVLAPSTANAIFAQVYVLSQASPTYTGTITNDAILQTPEDAYVLLPQIALTWSYTFLSGAQSNTDPGVGNYGFDTSLNGTMAHMYISFQNAEAPIGGGIVGLASGFKQWLDQAGNIGPFYFRIFSRSDPTIWWLAIATSVVDHTAYADVSITFIRQSNFTVGGPVQPTDVLDSVIAFDGFVPATETGQSGSATLAGDVSMVTANTFYDGPSVGFIGNTGETYLLTGYVTILGPAGTAKTTVRLTDGTTVYAEGENSIGATSTGVITLMALVPGNASYKFTATCNVNAATMKRDPVANSSGAHVASKLTYMRIS
jgi:hypothetical protein